MLSLHLVSALCWTLEGERYVDDPKYQLTLTDGLSQLKEVQSLSSLSLSTWTPSSESTRLPELRHNLHLIVDAAKQDVSGLVQEGKKVHERRRWALREEEISRAKAEEASTSETY